MFGYQDLKVSELVVFSETSNRLKWFYEEAPKFVELGFFFQQHFGIMEDVSTQTGEIQSFAFTQFVQFPYTLNHIYDQIMTGYYLESQILIRHLFESLLHLKYFHKYPENLNKHIEKNYSIKTMIEGITKNSLYEQYRFLCTYAHGFIQKDIHRTDRRMNKTYFGNLYKEDLCTPPINYFIELMLGFTNVYQDIFPLNTLESSAYANDLNKYVRNWCITYRDGHIVSNPLSAKWHEAMTDLVF